MRTPGREAGGEGKCEPPVLPVAKQGVSDCALQRGCPGVRVCQAREYKDVPCFPGRCAWENTLLMESRVTIPKESNPVFHASLSKKSLDFFEVAQRFFIVTLRLLTTPGFPPPRDNHGRLRLPYMVIPRSGPSGLFATARTLLYSICRLREIFIVPSCISPTQSRLLPVPLATQEMASSAT